MLKLGTQGVAALRLGPKVVKKAYLGDALVFGYLYTVTLLVNPAGGGSASGGGIYQKGAIAAVKAVAADGYSFSAWQEGANQLPAGYAKLEYIQSTGPQYIDTGIRPDSNTGIFAALSMTATSKSLYCFGANDGTNFFRAFSQSGGNGIQLFYGAASQTLVASMGERVTVALDRNAASAGNSTYTFPESTFSIGCNLFLFTDNTNGSPNTSRPAQMRLYSCRIYGNGALIRDFVPCKNPAGSVGLYDLAGGVFYENAGSGEFTAGPEIGSGVLVSTEAEYTFTVDGDRSLTAIFAKSSRLPDGYTEVEYVQTNSTAGYYIDTGKKPTATTELSIDFNLITAPSATQSIVNSYYQYGSGTAKSATRFSAHMQSAGIYVGLGSYPTTSTSSTKKISADVSPRRIHLEMDNSNKNASLTDSSGTKEITFTNNVSHSNTPSIKILGSASNNIIAKYYSCQIKDNGALIRDFVPCTDPSGAVGLYDLVEGKFYANSGTGTLTAGPAV